MVVLLHPCKNVHPRTRKATTMNIDRLKRKVHSIADLRLIARRNLPKAVFDFVDGAAEDERVVRRNESAFGELAFLPQPLTGTSERDQSIELFGERLSG